MSFHIRLYRRAEFGLTGVSKLKRNHFAVRVLVKQRALKSLWVFKPPLSLDVVGLTKRLET